MLGKEDYFQSRNNFSIPIQIRITGQLAIKNTDIQILFFSSFKFYDKVIITFVILKNIILCLMIRK